MENNFWAFSAATWEKKRYDKLFSRLFFSSLHYRRLYLAWLIDQLPPGISVLEIGCGSGRLYGSLPEHRRASYTGWDISAEAIELARKKYPEGRWECRTARDLANVQADVVISAGLLDWLSDADIRGLLSHPGFSYHAHSFSLETEGLKTRVHKLFSYLVSLRNKIPYKPRKFSLEEIQSLFGKLRPRIITGRKLSFGAFACVLPEEIDISFRSFLVLDYFNRKQNRISALENFFKKRELQAVRQALSGKIKGKSVLEIGSGAGVYTAWLQSEEPSHLQCVEPALQPPAPHVYRGTFQNFPAERNYQVILALGVLEFTPDPEGFIEKMLFLLAPGGEALILAPKERNPLASLYRFFHRCRGLQPSSGIETKLTQALSNSPQKRRFLKKSGGFLNNLFIIRSDG